MPSQKKRKSRQVAAPRRATTEPKKSPIPLLIALAAIAVVVFVVTQLKSNSQTATTTAVASSGLSPAAQLEQATAQNRPTYVFMHSTDCIPCKQMMTVVDEVYPEFSGQVVLVDVDVYDEQNGPLMRSLGLQYIPTNVIFDKNGQKKTYVGVMTPAELRTRLREAMGGN